MKVNSSLREAYGSFYEQGEHLAFMGGESASRQLNPETVPQELRALIPYARFWGIADDYFREELVRQAPPEVLQSFRAIVDLHKDRLVDWLAGPEAEKPRLTYEYVALSFMIQAYDYPRYCCRPKQ